MDIRRREDPNGPAGLSAFGLQQSLDKATPAYRLLLRAMDEAVDELDREGIEALRVRLGIAYRDLRTDKTFSRCIMTGHAHLDLVWIWPERMGDFKAVNIFATVDHLMKAYPELRFAYSQPASYESVARQEPDLYRRVKGRIRSGQWQATGAMYVESDTLLACGEALARSYLIGQEGFRKLAGKASCLTWLPDVFGYSACLPQIMRQTGVHYFFTTKMTWNAINRFPYSSFIWKGNDGSEVLAHVTQESGYVTEMSVDNIKAPMHANQQADVHREYLLPVGYGDGGGGPTAEMVERARRLGALPGMPDLEWDHPEAFFNRLESTRDRLPIHQGECYLEYHRGTFTTHGDLKASFRGFERALQTAEAVAAATGRRWDMTSDWKRQVFAQFHDYIPGSSVWDVYKEGLPEMDQAAARQRENALRALTARKGKKACLFNPHAVALKRWVRQPGRRQAAYVSLAPFSGAEIEEATTEQPESVKVGRRTVSNGLVSFRVNQLGWIDRLEWEGIEVPLAEPLAQLMLYPDRAANFEAWDIDRQTLSLGDPCRNRATIKPVRIGVNRSGLVVTRKVGKNSQVTVTLALEPGCPLVHISVDLVWHEPEHLLKLMLPTRYAATHARFGAPFGSVLRSQTTNNPQAEAMWEMPFSRYLAVFDEGEKEGLFVVSEAKYGASVRNGAIGLSLVRSPRVTGFDGHSSAWPPHLSRLKNLSPYSDQGSHRIELAVGRYSCDLPRERQPACLADTLYTPPVEYVGRSLGPVIESLAGGETLVPCWIKPVDRGGFVLRLHEVAGRRGELQIKASDEWSFYRTELDEADVQPLSDGCVKFTPYQIVSVLMTKHRRQRHSRHPLGRE